MKTPMEKDGSNSIIRFEGRAKRHLENSHFYPIPEGRNKKKKKKKKKKKTTKKGRPNRIRILSWSAGERYTTVQLRRRGKRGGY